MPVEKKVLLAAILATLVTGAVLALRNTGAQPEPAEPSTIHTSMKQPPNTPSRSRFTQIVAAKVTLPTAKPSAGVTPLPTSSVCEDAQEILLRKYSVADVLSNLEKISPESFGEKCGFPDEKVVEKYKKAEALCEKTLREGTDGEAGGNCWRAFLALRATIVKFRVKNTPLSEITDPSLLANLVVEALFDSRMVEFADAAERLYEIVPDDPEVVNAVVTGRFLTSAGDSSAGAKLAWSRFSEAVSIARSMQTGEVVTKLGNLELASFRLRNVSNEEFEKQAQRLLDEIPDLRPDVEYLRASMELNSGKTATCTKRLEALALEFPENEKVSKTLALIRKGQTKGAFSVSFDFQLPQLQPE